MGRFNRLFFIVLVLAVLIVTSISIFTPATQKAKEGSLRVAIAPYQDMAMLTNYAHLGLDEKYGLNIELVTVPWADLIPAVASAGPTVDVSFGGLIEFLNKSQQINKNSDDPVRYVFPLYVFKGGALMSFNPDVPDLENTIISGDEMKHFLSFKIGFPRYSVIHMMVNDMAAKAGMLSSDIKFTDLPYDDALLAAQNGSLDIVGVGLTQRAEALKRGGRVVANMENAEFADVAGFLVRQSTLETRRDDIEKLIRIWFESVDYVFDNLEENSGYTISYLDKKSATNYTIEEFKTALSNEEFPTSVSEAKQLLIVNDGQYSIERISESILKFLVQEGLVESSDLKIEPLIIEN